MKYGVWCVATEFTDCLIFSQSQQRKSHSKKMLFMISSEMSLASASTVRCARAFWLYLVSCIFKANSQYRMRNVSLAGVLCFLCVSLSVSLTIPGWGERGSELPRPSSKTIGFGVGGLGMLLACSQTEDPMAP